MPIHWTQLVLPALGILVLGGLSFTHQLGAEALLVFVAGVIMPSPVLQGDHTLRAGIAERAL